MIYKLGKYAAQISRVLACFACFYMLFIVAYNVLARAVYDRTDGAVNGLIFGALEQASYALLVFVFASMPYALCFGRGLVHVDLFVDRLPPYSRKFLSRLWLVGLCVLGCAFAFLFGTETLVLHARGDVSQDAGVPLYLFYGVITGLCAALGFSAFSGLFDVKEH